VVLGVVEMGDASGRYDWPKITLSAGLITGCPGSIPTACRIGINV
jgi:hypothetical protein